MPVTVGEIARRLRFLFVRNRMTAELEEEMRTHLAYRAESLRRSGQTEQDARHAARRRFGNALTLQEASRDMWGLISVEEVLRDVRHALRRMRRQPAVSLAVIVVMSLGIGATTAMFSAVDAAMLRPLPFRDAHRLVVLSGVQLPSDFGRSTADADEMRTISMVDAQHMPDLFSSVAAYASGGLNLSDAERPLRMQVGVVTADFFPMLGVVPVQGRTFVADDGRPGAPRVVVLSHALWQRHYGGRDMIGRTIPLNGKPYEVVGVSARGFSFPNESDLWIPLSVPITMATFEPFRGFLPSTTLARLTDGVDVAHAMMQLHARWTQAYGADTRPENQGWYKERLTERRRDGVLIPLQRKLTGDRRTSLLVLLGATGLLLLIACANVTNLLLSQAALRQREIAVRTVLGATRLRLVRQLLSESVLLALTGALLGVALAPLALRVLRMLSPSQLAGVAPPQLDLRVLAFSTALALITGIGFGLWPALGGTGAANNDTIKSGGGHGATARGMGRMRRTLVATEIALTVMLLIGAGLMLRSFSELMRIDSGMRVERVASLEMSFPSGRGSSPARLQKIEDILARLTVMPGIDAAGVVNDLPLGGVGSMALKIETDGPAPPEDAAFVRYLNASSGYFRALGIPLRSGRHFSVRDDSLAPRVAIVNEAMARLYWPNLNAVGRTFRFSRDTLRYTVVGVVGDVRELALDNAALPQMYFPVTTSTPSSVALLASGTLPPTALLARLTQAVHAVDPAQAVFHLRMMSDVVRGSVAPRRANTILISAFALLAFVLAALGVYAVVDYGVAQRTREFGIRAALGATGRDLLRLVASDMGLVIGLGIVAGLCGAWALSRVLQSLLYGVSAHDATTFVVVPLVLALSAAVAAWWPARRAMTVNPAEVMRAD